MVNQEPSATVNQLVTQADTLFGVYDNISKVISEMDIPFDYISDYYDNDFKETKVFNLEEMTRLYIYMQVGNYSQKQIAKRVQKWPYLQLRLGLERGPTQGHISHAIRNQFSPEFRQFMQQVAVGVREAALNHDIVASEVDSPNENPDPDEIASCSQPLEDYVDQHAPDLISTMLDDVAPSFDTGRASNRKHEDSNIWEQQLMMCLMDRAGTRSSYRTFNKFRNDPPHYDTHVRAVKELGKSTGYQFKLDDFNTRNCNSKPVPDWRRIVEEIQPQFNDGVRRMLDSVRTSEMFTEPVAAAIDVTGVPFHKTPWKNEDDIKPDDERIVVNKNTGRTKVPKDNYPEMVNGGKGDGVYEYQYATLTIVGRNAPLVLAVEPVRHDSLHEGDNGETNPWSATVDRLMEQATELVDIQLVMADRAFDSQGVFHVLDQRHDVNYLIPKSKRSADLREKAEEVRTDPSVTARIEAEASLELDDGLQYINTDADPDLDEDNYSHDLTFMHVPADRDDWIIRHADDTGYAIFVTNCEDVSPLDAEGLTNRYSDRWDIENEYKMIQPLMPSIASTDYRMRFFAFVFSCLVYNLWRVVDHSMKELASEAFDDYGRGPHEKRLDTLLPLADYLASSIILLFNDGWDPPDVAAE